MPATKSAEADWNDGKGDGSWFKGCSDIQPTALRQLHARGLERRAPRFEADGARGTELARLRCLGALATPAGRMP